MEFNEDIEEEIYLCLEIRKNTENCIFLYEECVDFRNCAKEGRILFRLHNEWCLASTYSSIVNGSSLDYGLINDGDYVKQIRSFEINRILN